MGMRDAFACYRFRRNQEEEGTHCYGMGGSERKGEGEGSVLRPLTVVFLPPSALVSLLIFWLALCRQDGSQVVFYVQSMLNGISRYLFLNSCLSKSIATRLKHSPALYT